MYIQTFTDDLSIVYNITKITSQLREKKLESTRGKINKERKRNALVGGKEY